MTENTGDTSKYLPGDVEPDEALRRALRVDHAGEFGAVRIYAGQLAVLDATDERDGAYRASLQEMAEQEDEHLAAFCDLLAHHRVRPSALMPFWHVAGFALGAATALMGKRAAMACTVAVETEIIRHYQDQIDRFSSDHPELTAKLARFRDDEAHHRDEAAEQGGTIGHTALRKAISLGSRLAIRIAERV